jgi:hypothetical protein
MIEQQQQDQEQMASIVFVAEKQPQSLDQYEGLKLLDVHGA